jgi:hypothetical protein
MQYMQLGNSVLKVSRVLGVQMPDFPLNESDSQERIRAYVLGLIDVARSKGYERYLERLPA